MTNHRYIRIVSTAASIVATAAVCAFSASCSEQPDLAEGLLTRTADRAKQQGHSKVEIPYVEENAGRTPTLADALQVDTFMVGVATAQRILAVTSDDIRTWFVFDQAEHVAGPPPTARSCRIQPPSGVEIRPGQVAVPLRVGTTDVRGITLSFKGAHTDLSPRAGQRYLLIGERCDGPVLIPTQNQFSILALKDDGALEPLAGRDTSNHRVGEEILSLGTLDRLRAKAVVHLSSNRMTSE